MYQKILVPLDGSKRAERILPHVEELAHRYNAKIVFLQVVDITNEMLGLPGSTITLYAEIEHWLDDAKLYLVSLKGEFREKGIPAKALVERGAVAKKIIDVAEREDVDLIAMASHGRTGLSRVFYGSVAAGVLNQVDRPLLLIRARSST